MPSGQNLKVKRGALITFTRGMSFATDQGLSRKQVIKKEESSAREGGGAELMNLEKGVGRREGGKKTMLRRPGGDLEEEVLGLRADSRKTMQPCGD